jgi:hypothetical protein
MEPQPNQTPLEGDSFVLSTKTDGDKKKAKKPDVKDERKDFFNVGGTDASKVRKEREEFAVSIRKKKK